MHAFTPDEIRRILLELRYVYTVKQLCEKWHITPYRLRQWQHQWHYAYLTGNLHELVIAALYHGAQTIDNIRAYVDYLDHTLYTPEEISKVLKQLEFDGLARNDDAHWLYNAAHSHNDLSFIF